MGRTAAKVRRPTRSRVVERRGHSSGERQAGSLGSVISKSPNFSRTSRNSSCGVTGSDTPPLPCHVTLKVRRGLPSLRGVKFVREMERSFAAACDRGRFRVVHYSIQNDHLHAIVEATSQRDLAHGMKSIGSRLARAVNRIFGRRGSVLADRYHLHILRTPREVRNAIAYVLLNARRHLAKLGRRLPTAAGDPASSGRRFSGWNRRFQPGSSIDPPPVAPPRTWLLRAGWRRHGLVSPTEVPGGPASSSR